MKKELCKSITLILITILIVVLVGACDKKKEDVPEPVKQKSLEEKQLDSYTMLLSALDKMTEELGMPLYDIEIEKSYTDRVCQVVDIDGDGIEELLGFEPVYVNDGKNSYEFINIKLLKADDEEIHTLNESTAFGFAGYYSENPSLGAAPGGFGPVDCSASIIKLYDNPHIFVAKTTSINYEDRFYDRPGGDYTITEYELVDNELIPIKEGSINKDDGTIERISTKDAKQGIDTSSIYYELLEQINIPEYEFSFGNFVGFAKDVIGINARPEHDVLGNNVISFNRSGVAWVTKADARAYLESKCAELIAKIGVEEK